MENRKSRVIKETIGKERHFFIINHVFLIENSPAKIE